MNLSSTPRSVLPASGQTDRWGVFCGTIYERRERDSHRCVPGTSGTVSRVINNSHTIHPMKTLGIIAVFTGLCFASALAAPGDRIDAKDLKNKVTLTLGSKGTIQLKPLANALNEPTLIKDPDEKQPGISVEFKKEPDFLALNLKNRLPKALWYRAAVRLKGRKEYVETSLIVPVAAGLISFETWQDPIEELVLFDFRLTDEKR